MRLVCIAQQLTGDYGTVTAGQEFECREDVAMQLIRGGKARKPGSPRVLYETKPASFEAPEVSPRQPFRDSSVPDQKSEELAPESDSMFSGPDLPVQGNAHRGGRGRRPGSVAE